MGIIIINAIYWETLGISTLKVILLSIAGIISYQRKQIIMPHDSNAIVNNVVDEILLHET